MRITHFELLQMFLGNTFKYLEQYYGALSTVDTDPDHPIPEYIFDKAISAQTCSQLFGTPNDDRSSRIQRKMDLAVLQQTYHLWKDQRYFEISPALTSKLIDTDMKDTDTFFLRAPGRSMYISLPKGNGLFIPNSKSGLHEVDSIYLTFNDYEEAQDLLLPIQQKKIEGVTKHIHMLVCGEQKGTFGDAVMFFDLIFFEGKVSASIEKNKEILENHSLWPYMTTIFNFVSKVLLYINCANISIQKIAGLDLESKLEGLKGSAKKRKLLQKYSKISPKAHNLLDVVINHDQNPHGGDKTVTMLGPKSLEKVRPHFKTQRYGTGRAQAKIIWVESYIRGEGTEFYQDKHTYKVI